MPCCPPGTWSLTAEEQCPEVMVLTIFWRLVGRKMEGAEEKPLNEDVQAPGIIDGDDADWTSKKRDGEGAVDEVIVGTKGRVWDKSSVGTIKRQPPPAPFTPDFTAEMLAECRREATVCYEKSMYPFDRHFKEMFEPVEVEDLSRLHTATLPEKPVPKPLALIHAFRVAGYKIPKPWSKKMMYGAPAS